MFTRVRSADASSPLWSALATLSQLSALSLTACNAATVASAASVLPNISTLRELSLAACKKDAAVGAKLGDALAHLRALTWLDLGTRTESFLAPEAMDALAERLPASVAPLHVLHAHLPPQWANPSTFLRGLVAGASFPSLRWLTLDVVDEAAWRVLAEHAHKLTALHTLTLPTGLYREREVIAAGRAVLLMPALEMVTLGPGQDEDLIVNAAACAKQIEATESGAVAAVAAIAPFLGTPHLYESLKLEHSHQFWVPFASGLDASFRGSSLKGFPPNYL